MSQTSWKSAAAEVEKRWIESHREMMGWSHWPIFQLLLIYESLLLQTMCLFHCQHTACQDNRHWRTKNYTLMHTRIIKLKSYSNPNCTTDLYRQHIKGGAVKQDIWTFIHLEIWDIKQVGVILKNIVWRYVTHKTEVEALCTFLTANKLLNCCVCYYCYCYYY